MKIDSSPYQVPFHKLIDLFTGGAGHTVQLAPCFGKGSLEVFNLEEGLEAKFWNCHFKEEIEIYSKENDDTEKECFSIAFFLNREGVQLENSETLLQENIAFDTLFIPATFPYRIYISAGNRFCCLSASISKKWLSDNILNNDAKYKSLKEKIFTTKSFALLESMGTSEKSMILELLSTSGKSFGTFYIKSVLLKAICDFFYKIKDRETVNNSNHSTERVLHEIETFLCNNKLNSLPNLKDLAQEHFMSESTMKRHFKKRHGVNISTYFLYKKLEYAQQLMCEKKLTITEAAHILGYRNTSHFATQYKKYIGIQPQSVQPRDAA